MLKTLDRIKIYALHHWKDPLNSHSYLLISNALSLSFFGFIFWSLAAKLYTPHNIGLASSLISISLIILNLANLGLSTGLIRFLPNSKKQIDLVNSAISIIFISSIILSLVFFLFINLFSSELSLILKNPTYMIVFILLNLFWGLSNLLDTLFLSLKSPKTMLTKNLLYSLIKFPLLIMVIRWSSLGIIFSLTLAFLLTTFFYYIYVLPKLLSNYKFRFILDFSELKTIISFALLNHLANLVGSLHTSLLPLMILSTLGAQYSGFYYIAYNIAGLLFFISSSYATIFFIEGSYDANKALIFYGKSIKRSFILTLLGTGATLLLGSTILSFFGKDYTINSLSLLKYLALSSFPISFINLSISLLRVKFLMKEVLILSLATSLLTLLLTFIFSKHYGLTGIGIAWLTAHSLVALICFPVIKKKVLL